MSPWTPASWHALGPNRRLVNDLLYFSRDVPLFPLERPFALAAVDALRRSAEPRIAWPALFLKAYGLVARRRPELRQTYQRYPWPHLYEHPHSVAMVAVSRETPSGPRLCWARFTAPEDQSLVELQASLDDHKTSPLELVFRRQLRLSRFPAPMRRIAWWLSLNTSGSKRAKRVGTFGLSTVASQGAINRFHPSCLTTSLSYGPLDATGTALVTAVCDHRVVDGAPMAAVLNELEAALQGTIADELGKLQRRASAA